MRKIVIALAVVMLFAGCGNNSSDEVLEQQSTDETNKEKVQTEQANQEREYLDKLYQTEESLNDDLKDLYASSSTNDEKEALAEAYRRWDDVLNEIYDVLQTTLSTTDVNELDNLQHDWLKFRERQAETALSEFADGSFESVEYLSTLADLTKERCYFLVENYMK
ncbi:lysozyme inhibitor LprI family protein [Sporosarcina sp. FSL K6-1522]|uniref:lysozyme inhibitor LprI family protein n=1 Tax=Sporosarcina sp. FSL K6-1522 TaxID=2921554 RepID=UPI003159ACFB